MTALLFAFMINPLLIRWLKVKQGKGQPIRSDGPQRHIIEKAGHAHHGRAADPDPLGGVDAALGQICPTAMSGSSLLVTVALRPARFPGRLL